MQAAVKVPHLLTFTAGAQNAPVGCLLTFSVICGSGRTRTYNVIDADFTDRWLNQFTHATR